MANIDSVKLPNGNEYNLKDVVTPRDFTNPNLLINPWFTVNQRGLASYTPNNSYTLDRWLSPASSDFTVTVTSNGVTLSSISGNKVFRQKIDYLLYLLGKTVTISLLLADGTIIAGTNICPATDGGEWSVNFGVNSKVRLINSSGLLLFDIVVGSGETINARAVKLEIGSTSTLHLDTAPDYTTELLKCQRYYYRISSSADDNIFSYAIQTNSNWAVTLIAITATMRAKPSISRSGTFVVNVNGSTNNVIEMAVTAMTGNNVQVSMGVSGTAGAIGTLRNSGASSYIELSAEL